MSEMGTDVWHGLRPLKPASEFVKYVVPESATVVRRDRSYGDLLVSGGDNFTRFHSNFHENTDSIITLYGAGEKIWFFAPGGRVAKNCEKNLRDVESFYQFSCEVHKEVQYCIQGVGDTVFFPYTWLHCVITVGTLGACASLLSVGLSIPRAVHKRKFTKAANLLPVDEDRTKTVKRGKALSCCLPHLN